MTKEQPTQEEIERAAIKSMANFGAPKDLWIDDYGWVIKDGEPTDIGLEWYRIEMMGIKDGRTRNTDKRKK